jgi:hypothetical protein
MAFVSVTRLRLRSFRFLPQFVYYTFRSTAQLRRSPGFLQGWAGNEAPFAFWTATAWASQEAMRAFRNGSPHLEAMKNLLHWCDEASFAHWEQPQPDLPDPATALQRIGSEGKISKVLHPSARHAAGKTAGTRPPRIGQRILPGS